MYNITLRHDHATFVAVEKHITYSECVLVALCIQHAMHMHHIVICSLSGSTIFFPHYLTNSIISFEGSGGGGIEHKMCVLIFSTTFV